MKGLHTYKGHTIRSCDQIGIGNCTGRGWHIRSYHHATGLPWAEGETYRYNTLAEAKEAINLELQEEGEG